MQITKVFICAATFCLLGLNMWSGPAFAAYFNSTSTVVSWCRSDDTLNRDRCYIYLQAIADAIDAKPSEVGKPVSGAKVQMWEAPVCMPLSLSPSNLRRAFLSYVDIQGDIRARNPSYVAAEAFAAYWPCQTDFKVN